MVEAILTLVMALKDNVMQVLNKLVDSVRSAQTARSV